MTEVDLLAVKKFAEEIDKRTRHLNDIQNACFSLHRLLDAGTERTPEAEDTGTWMERFLGKLRFVNSAPWPEGPKKATVWLFTDEEYDKSYSFRGLDLKINRRIAEGLVNLLEQVAAEENAELREFIKTWGVQNGAEDENEVEANIIPAMIIPSLRGGGELDLTTMKQD